MIRIRLKIAEKKSAACNWIFEAVRKSTFFFRSFFAFRLEIHVRGDTQYKTGAAGGTILGQPMLFECMGVSAF